MAHITAQHESAVVRVLDDTRLIEDTSSYGKACTLIPTGDIESVVVYRGGAEDEILPVDTFSEAVEVALREVFASCFGERIDVIQFGVLARIHHVEFFRDPLDAVAAGYFHTRRAFTPLFGGHNDDPVGTAGSVDGRRRCIFEDLDAFYVGRVDERRLGRESIDNPQRFVSTLDGVCSAYADLHARTGLSRVLLYLDASREALQRLSYVSTRKVRKVAAADGGDGACEVFTLCRTVADDNDLVEARDGRRHLHIDRCTLPNGDGNRFISDEREYQHSILSVVGEVV